MKQISHSTSKFPQLRVQQISHRTSKPCGPGLIHHVKEQRVPGSFRVTCGGVGAKDCAIFL
jgi:hypothetical protein